MTDRGMFANGIADELAAISISPGLVLRVGRATDSHHRIGKGELFIEASRNGAFVYLHPLNANGPADAEFRGRKILRYGLATEPLATAVDSDDVSSRFELRLPEGVIWIELLVAA